MTTRQDIEALLDRAYAARLKQDLGTVFDCFCHDGQFRVNGSTTGGTREAQRATLQGIFAAFTLEDFSLHCRVIDPPNAVVHWAGKFRVNRTGDVVGADVLDLVEVRDGKIAALTSFFDTALVERALAA